jgi:hypothetical protein
MTQFSISAAWYPLWAAITLAIVVAGFTLTNGVSMPKTSSANKLPLNAAFPSAHSTWKFWGRRRQKATTIQTSPKHFPEVPDEALRNVDLGVMRTSYNMYAFPQTSDPDLVPPQRAMDVMRQSHNPHALRQTPYERSLGMMQTQRDRDIMRQSHNTYSLSNDSLEVERRAPAIYPRASTSAVLQ